MDEEKYELHEERKNVLWLIDSFIHQINSMRKFLAGVAISAIVMTPFAILLSVYLLSHPSFLTILEKEGVFGIGLFSLLTVVIIISVILFITGILQYRKIRFWYKKYTEYKKAKDDIDRKISEKFNFEE